MPEATPSGSGATNALALWTNASTLGSSVMYQSGSGAAAKIGIGLVGPASALDVNGGTTLRGVVSLLAPSAATATAGMNSPYFEFNASSYDSGTAAPVAQKFASGVLVSGNDTAAPSSNFDLLYGQGTTGVGPTGFSISPKGILTFAPGPTFPGASGGAGTITRVTAGTGLTGGGTSGAVTVNVDTTKVPLLTAANTFTQSQTVKGGVTASSFSANNPSGLGVFGGSSGTLSATGSQNGPAQQTGIWADAGPDTQDENYGLFATADNAPAGFFLNDNAHKDNVAALRAQNLGTGLSLEAYTDGYGTAIYAQSENASQVSQNQIVNYNAAIWADSSDMTGIIGSSDAYSGGSFFNNSECHATIDATNYYTGSGSPGSGLAVPVVGNKGFGTVIRAEGSGGVCGMNTEGDVSCTGQMKSLNTLNGARQVETYSV